LEIKSRIKGLSDGEIRSWFVMKEIFELNLNSASFYQGKINFFVYIFDLTKNLNFENTLNKNFI
jgi:hypothetical protein